MVTIVMLSGCAFLRSSASYRLQPLDGGTQSRLECQKSSSGTCIFELVEHGGTKKSTYDVLEGSSIDVAVPEAGVDLCVYAVRSKLVPCNPQIYNRGAFQHGTAETRVN
jgi:hypothetical protein